MRILLTGASGFIGQHLTSVLTKQRQQIFTLDRKNRAVAGVTSLAADLADRTALQRAIKTAAPDVCVHMAWQGLPDYSEENNALNTRLSLNLIEELQQNNCQKVILTGSCWQYGKQSGCMSEDTLPRDQSPLAAAKNSIRETAVAAKSDMKIQEARIFFAYGPGQRTTSLVPSVVSALKNGQRPEIKNPNAAEDFISIHDVVSALTILVQELEPKFDLVNIGSGKLTSVAEVANLCCRHFGKPDLLPMPTNPAGTFANIERMCSYGWQPQVTLAQGLREMMS